MRFNPLRFISKPLGVYLGFNLAALFNLAFVAIAQPTVPSQETISPPLPEPFPKPLPSESPAPPPEPNLQTPPSQASECISPTTDRARFSVKKVEVLGSTVLQAEMARLIKPFENSQVTFEDLICLRSKITELYINNGYINSGAFLPNNHDLSSGIVQIQVVEGELEKIEVNGLSRLREGYVRSRLERGASKPLNQQRLEEALQLLQLDPILEQVNAELTAGSVPGRSILQVNLKEAPAFHASLAGDNYRSPSIGSAQGSLSVSHDNLLGFGDRLSTEYGLTEGLSILDIRYSIPLNALNGTLSLRFENSDSNIIEEEFDEFDISSETQTISLSFRQPIVRSPDNELALGLALDLRRSQTFLLDQPFSFSIGAENGESNVTAIRVFQEWVERSPTSVLAARSQFSFGIDAFGATINDTGTDGRFFSWQGQFQWVQQLSPRILLLARIDAQLTPDSLLSPERFSLGGVDTVRGYVQNQLVADNGILGSIELRIPLTSDPSVLQLVPFVDVGTGWHDRSPDPDPSTLIGVGLGCRWLITPNLSLRLDYGIPLISVDNRGDSLQDNGLYFSLRYQPF
jgi:hemolysin activation/secretion protein